MTRYYSDPRFPGAAITHATPSPDPVDVARVRALIARLVPGDAGQVTAMLGIETA